MTCPHAQSMIQNYRDGELDAKTAQALEEHLSRCADCRREYQALQRLSSVIAESPVPEPPAGYWEAMQFAVMRQIRSQAAPRAPQVAWWQWLFFRPAFAMGVVVVLAFVGGIFVGRVSARPMPMASPNLTARQPVPSPPSNRIVRDDAVRPEKSRAIVQGVATPPKPSAPKQKMKTSGKLVRVVRQAPSVCDDKARRQRRVPTPQLADMPTFQPSEGYVVYSLEPPPLTLSSSADSVSSSDANTRATDGSVSGEVVAPVHQQLIVPLSVVNVNQRGGTPSSESSSSQESKSAPII